MSTNYAASAMARGVRSNFRGQYASTYKFSQSMLPFVQFGMSTKEFASLFMYPEKQRYPTRTPWGVAPFRKPMRYIPFTVPQYRWTSAVDLLERDVELSQLGGIEQDAKQTGDNFGTLVERCSIQIMTGATDPDLLPTLPVAPDLSPMYYATDGYGADRFGYSGGNIDAGNELSTGPGMRIAVANGMERLMRFQDTEGQPLINPAILMKGITVIYPPGLFRQWLEAFHQTMSPDAGGAVPVTNFLSEAGYKFRGIPNPRLTDETVIYMFLDGAPIKPLFELISKPMFEQFYDRKNSQAYGEAGKMGWLFEKWFGMGLTLPMYTVKITG